LPETLFLTAIQGLEGAIKPGSREGAQADAPVILDPFGWWQSGPFAQPHDLEGASSHPLHEPVEIEDMTDVWIDQDRGMGFSPKRFISCFDIVIYPRWLEAILAHHRKS
jgi:hypothetical protein